MKISRTFLLAFQRQYVTVLLKNLGSLTLKEAAEDSYQIEGPAAVSGHVLDNCDNFLYLGNKEGVIDKAVAIDNIVTVYLDTEIKEQFVEGPKNALEIN